LWFVVQGLWFVVQDLWFGVCGFGFVFHRLQVEASGVSFGGLGRHLQLFLQRADRDPPLHLVSGFGLKV
jgi:hypothetical protein